MSTSILKLTAAHNTAVLPGGLESIIQVLEPVGQRLVFSVFIFEGTLKETASLGYQDLQSLLSASEQGLALNWNELVRLAAHTDDVSDLLLAGYPITERPRLCADFDTLASECQVVLEVFDSTSLRFASKDDALVHRARAAFPALQQAHDAAE